MYDARYTPNKSLIDFYVVIGHQFICSLCMLLEEQNRTPAVLQREHVQRFKVPYLLSSAVREMNCSFKKDKKLSNFPSYKA